MTRRYFAGAVAQGLAIGMIAFALERQGVLGAFLICWGAMLYRWGFRSMSEANLGEKIFGFLFDRTKRIG